MSSELSADLKAEIGHVLFVDIVGYSKLLINEQTEELEYLNEMVRGSEQVRAADAQGKLIRLATGDGMALVFRNDPEAPAKCALELSRADKQHPELQLRMGIHSGPINEVTDVNERANVTGAGINMAQRVMDCGDAGHILLSKRVADDLAQYRHWQPYLHELGECVVKHGVRLDIVNLYTDELGNPELPGKFKPTAPAAVPEAKASSRKYHWVLREPRFAVAAALAAVGLLIGIVTISQQWRRTAIPDKSIAVLPLANESGDASQQYFSDGLSEDLITALSQFAGLKVIDRNSSFQFRDSKDSSASIGAKLGVASLLEGSVRHAGDVIRISATLVKAADGSTLWSERYDRPYKDLFALQDDITKAVAGALQAKLLQTGGAGAVGQSTRPPSGNLDAYNAWLQGNFYAARRGGEDDLRRTIAEYDRAIELDPRYAQAYADRSYAQTDFAGSYLADEAAADTYKHAREDAQRALSLAPDLASAHRALGYVLQLGDLDTVGAEAELRKAVAVAPDSAEAKTNFGLAEASRGHLEEGVGQIQQAVQLDPLDGRAYRALGDIELALGRLDQAEQATRKAVELRPDVGTNRRSLIYVDVRRGDYATAMRDAQQEPSAIFRTVETTFALQIGNDRGAADAALKDFIAKYPDLTAFQIAELYALRKDPGSGVRVA